MPTRLLGPCTTTGCPQLATDHGKCDRHAAEREQRYDQERGTRTARGYDNAWLRFRAVYLRQHPGCVRCGRDATEVDHVIPLRRGGTTDEGNLQALCHTCHSAKTAREDGRWGPRVAGGRGERH